MSTNVELIARLRAAAKWEREMEYDGGHADLLEEAADALAAVAEPDG